MQLVVQSLIRASHAIVEGRPTEMVVLQMNAVSALKLKLFSNYATICKNRFDVIFSAV